MLAYVPDSPAWREALPENLGATPAAQTAESQSAKTRSLVMTDIQHRKKKL
jgi:hypothetical protein